MSTNTGSRLALSRLVLSRRSLVARVGIMVALGSIASCQSAKLQSSNIANETCNGQPCAVPISDGAVIASGGFVLDNTKLDGIRAALTSFAPEAHIHVNRNG